ncbi:MAG: ABC transporter ATP-binding protein/permease [Acidimicrobiales bacterium]|nr:MAG: ABC transporter ATP-binding protein/permease [Acidimicrobiales bacterium]
MPRGTKTTVPKEEKLSYQLKSFMRLWPYLWPKEKPTYKIRTFIALLFTIAGQFILVGAPFFLGRSVDAVKAAQETASTWSIAGLFISALILGYGGLRFVSILISEAREYLFTPVGQYAQRQIATATFAHLHKLSLRYHLEKRTGGLSRIIERGIRSIDFLFRFLLFNIGPTLLQLAIAGAAFWLAYDWRFALIAVAIVLMYIWFTIITTEWRLAFRREMNKQDTEANAKAIDSLLNYETVKYFNAENFEVSRYDGAMEGYQKAAIKSRTSLATVNIGQSFLMNIGLVAMMLLAAMQILKNEMTVGSMTTITLVMLQVYRPLNILGFAYREIKQALTDMEKMFALLDIPPEVKDSPGAEKLRDVRGAIKFENVAFHYEADRPILEDVSFTIEPGETVAIVGPTGAGKSTLSRILFRFYDIQSGRVTIDGKDIRDVTQDSLRRAIGIVPQDTVLFNDTILYNIGYANPYATQDEIEAAAKAAQIHDFIMSLPGGYQTQVGERGLKLSGGEKQRVAIARTLLKKPAILILDEATSALDSVTEREIQSALDEISKKHTTLTIAHRLSTIVNADKIIVMENGRIKELGSHANLLVKNGLYSSLWAQQEKTVI